MLQMPDDAPQGQTPGVDRRRPVEASTRSLAQKTYQTLREAIERVIERVREGTSLARALGDTHVFPPLLVHLVASGEASGKLDQLLERAARLQTQSLERRLAVFLTVLEPVVVLLLGGMVLLIVLAILLPIIQINQLVR